MNHGILLNTASGRVNIDKDKQEESTQGKEQKAQRRVHMELWLT